MPLDGAIFRPLAAILAAAALLADPGRAAHVLDGERILHALVGAAEGDRRPLDGVVGQARVDVDAVRGAGDHVVADHQGPAEGVDAGALGLDLGVERRGVALHHLGDLGAHVHGEALRLGRKPIEEENS